MRRRAHSRPYKKYASFVWTRDICLYCERASLRLGRGVAPCSRDIMLFFVSGVHEETHRKNCKPEGVYGCLKLVTSSLPKHTLLLM